MGSSAISRGGSFRRFLWVIVVGLFVAAGTVSLAPVLAAAPDAANPCATNVAHPHLDPNRRLPALVKTSGTAGRPADVLAGRDGAGGAPAHNCVQKVVYRWELDRERRP